jgi:head-tail adaptor
MPSAGDLRDRIGFYSRIQIDDGAGNVEGGYDSAPNFTVSAGVRPKLGGEAVLAGRLTGTNYVNVTVRQSSLTRQVNVDWMARDERKGVAYNIRSIIDPLQGKPGQGAWLEMLCEEGVAIGPMATPGLLDFEYPGSSGLLALLEDI